ADLRDRVKQEFRPYQPALRTAWRWAPLVFVWGVWAALVAANVALVLKYRVGSLPTVDEWRFVSQPLTFEWLWEQYYEHRLPLAKFAGLAVTQLTGYAFRFGNFLSIALVAAVAAGVLLTARRLRGRFSFADAFFPLALLNVGQGYNFYCFWQVNHILPAMAGC